MVTYFRKEISVNVLKITIKFNVNFLSIVLNYTLYLTMSAFWKSCWLYYISLLQQECRFTIFCKILLSKSVCRRFSIIKLFLKNFTKLTGSYMKLKVAGWKETPVQLRSCTTLGVFLEPYQTSMIKLLAVVFSQKRSIIDIWQGSKYGSAASFFNIWNNIRTFCFCAESVQLLSSCDVNQKCYLIFYCFPNYFLYIDHGNTKFSYIYMIEKRKSSLWETSRWNARLMYTINKNNNKNNNKS